MGLTGRFTFRRKWTGRIVLQVEEELKAPWPMSRKSPFRKRWRDAALMDLAAPEMRALMDLRFKPQFMAPYEHLAPEREPPSMAPGQDLSAFDGIPVGPARLLAEAARRPKPPAARNVEVESYRGRVGGRAGA